MSASEFRQQRDAARERLVHQAFIEALGKRAIPADWVECRVLPTRTPAGQHGLHVQFVVRQGGDRLLPHHAAIEDAFLRSAAAADPLARKWIFSVAWVLNDRTGAEPAGWRIDARHAVAA